MNPLKRGECAFFDVHLVPVIFFNIEDIHAANLKLVHDMEYHLFSLNFRELDPMFHMFKNLVSHNCSMF